MNAFKWKLVYILCGAILLALFIVMVIDLAPLVEGLVANRGHEEVMVGYIKNFRLKGIPIIMALAVAQVVVAFFPAASIQVLAGLCYGTLGGGALCITGYVMGNLLVFWVLRQFKKATTQLSLPRKKTKKKPLLEASKIRDMQNPEILAFVLYLMPGIPNGILPYLFAETKISFSRYFIVITSASIPSVLACTWLGRSLSQKNYPLCAAIVLGLLLVTALVLIFQKKIVAVFSGHDAKNEPDI